jgi:radical SAM protein with 4Fe4S-binding SPASM domain
MYNMSTCVLSNTHDYINNDFKRATSLIDSFESTFHGPGSFEHDSIAMKEGAFDYVISNLKRLSNSGAKSIGVVYNITPQNCRDLYKTIEGLILQHKLPIDHLVIQRIIPMGRAQSTSKFAAGSVHAISAIEDVSRIIEQFGITVSFEDPFPFCIVPEKFHKYLSRCEWGFSRASLDNIGNLSRCGADTRFRIGNIFETPLPELWNTSPILTSFRSREYLPDDCLGCRYLEKCGGGCALSCEIEKDHAPDYMRFEKRNAHVGPGSSFDLIPAGSEDLSEILRMEWACFPEYEFKFVPADLRKWYGYNPDMFFKLVDSDDRILGYSCFVPLTASGYHKFISGVSCSLHELDLPDVAQKHESKLWHLEVVGTIADIRSRAGRALIRNTGSFLLNKADFVTATPITDIGRRLCNYFSLKPVATDSTGLKSYLIFGISTKDSSIKRALEKF